LIALDNLVAALRRLPGLAEVEAADLFDVERRAFSMSGRSGYKKTALFLVAILFDRMAQKAEREEPKSGQAYSAICAKAVEALRVDGWNDGAGKLEEIVDMCWQSQLLH